MNKDHQWNCESSARASGEPSFNCFLPSFLSFQWPPPPHFPPQITADFPHVKKKIVQIYMIVIPHQFAPKQIVVNCEFLIKFVRILITLDPYVLCIPVSR